MISKCDKCSNWFDDEFRRTICPHGTFAANDGKNNFNHHPESYLDTISPEHREDGGGSGNRFFWSRGYGTSTKTKPSS